MYGSANANRSALLIQDQKKKKEKREDAATHTVPIRFWIHCILACQGTEPSVGGIDDNGVLSVA